MSNLILIDAGRTTTPLPHFWSHMFGSCHAVVTMHERWRKDLRALKECVDVRYVRFHGIFDREVGLYQGQDEDGRLLLNFTRVDEIYDGLLDIGVRPFVELSFMPPALAQTVEEGIHPFHYHPNVGPPRDPVQWYHLVRQFVAHLVERYGANEVARWYFEVWNEPNIDFLAGASGQKWERYTMLYALAARAIKAIDKRIAVGGPATAAAKWVPAFIDYCVTHNVPVDFVSTHVYPHDDPRNILGPDVAGTQEVVVAKAVRKIYDEVKASRLPHLPIIWTEYNAGFDPAIWQTDLPYVGPWLANTIRLCDGLAAELSYWTFTDAGFEELGVLKKPFGTGFGLFATGGIKKPAFNVFKVLNLLGDKRIPLDSEAAIATRRLDGTLVAAVWNYVLPGETGSDRQFCIKLANASDCNVACVNLVDEEHGNAQKLWREMGSPAFPSREAQHQLRMAGELAAASVTDVQNAELALTLAPNALAVIEFIREGG